MKRGASAGGGRVGRQAWTCLVLLLMAATLLSCAVSPLRSDRPRGVYHRVKAGETLFAIARAYQVELQELAEINNIRDPAQIELGSVIFVPSATRIVDAVMPAAPPSEPAPPRPALAAPKAKPERVAAAPAERQEEKRPGVRPEAVPPPSGEAAPGGAGVKQKAIPVREPPKDVAVPPPPRKPDAGEGKPAAASPDSGERQKLSFEKQRFIWPVKGKVILPFGIQPNRMYNNGIRIAAPAGTAVLAAAAGTVDFSASLKDYGETIIIIHADQYATVYTHLGIRTVGRETRVRKGDRIAFLADGEQGEPFLHFEIRHQNKARNPLFFLP
jgi:lipoprotein NlpD